MNDQSHLDSKYFLSEDRYNCPFCNRGSVLYKVRSRGGFNWSDERIAHYYIVECQSCQKKSLHLSDYLFYNALSDGFLEIDDTDIEETDTENIDQYFFYHQPTSFFTVDSRVPVKIRELISEADGCKKMNYNVGASGALRKAIYEFIVDQGTDISQSYEERIKSLKQKHPTINVEYFDALANIQGMTSEQLHEQEGSWEAWAADDITFLINMFSELLREIYVIPDDRKQQFNRISQLRSKSGSFQKTIKPPPEKT